MTHSNIAVSSGNQEHISQAAETHTGTTTSWLSLITSPPLDPRCSRHVYSPDGAYHTLIAFDPRLETAANLTCLPREAAAWYTQKILPFGATTGIVTSLGPMICPSGYTTASISKKDITSTMVFCCPSRYGFATSADHGHLYGCTSLQTRRLTVHLSGATASVGTLAAGSPSRAPNVAGIAVNGWILKPSPALTLPTATCSGDVWARVHLGMTTAEFSGIVVAALASVVILLFALAYCIKKKYGVRKGQPEEKGPCYVGDGTRESSLSGDRGDLDQTRDIELADLDPSGSTVSSGAETVVRHIQNWKSEGSSTEYERTA